MLTSRLPYGPAGESNEMRADGYVLATGGGAIERLQLLDRVFGLKTRELLLEIGLDRANRVADIGCGTGLVATWAAERLGRHGSVTAIDVSAEQLAVGRSICSQLGLKNVDFREGSAYETGLERGVFDIVYSRFLMCHLARPQDALSEMCALVKPGGVLVCEDYDAYSVVSDPPTPAYQRLHAISTALDRVRGVDSEIGTKLHRFFHGLPLGAPRVRFQQPAFLTGDSKRFWELTLREATPAIIDASIATQSEIEDLCSAMVSIANDPRCLVIVGRVCQTWAIKQRDSQ
jgi:SAM-dependent methyltransferase